MTQFSPEDPASAYLIRVSKPLLKLFRRLETITSSCEIHLYLDDRGQVRSLRVLNAKEEFLGLDKTEA